MKPWQEIYNEWKYWNPTKTHEERTRLVRGCIGKMAYPNFLAAMGFANLIEARDPKSRLNIYHCPICHQIHVGNTKWRIKW